MPDQNPVQALHGISRLALMAALVAAGAYCRVPFGPVPISFQDFFVLLAGLILGPRAGALSVGLYLLAGLLGLPVFSGGRSGLGHLLGPSGGFLYGFLGLAFCSGLGARQARLKLEFGKAWFLWTLPLAAGILPGLVLMYLCGAVQLAVVMDFSPMQALGAGVLPFLPLGLGKAVLCVIVWRMMLRRGLI